MMKKLLMALAMMAVAHLMPPEMLDGLLHWTAHYAADHLCETKYGIKMVNLSAVKHLKG
jgi:hypothetical protein